MLIYLKKSAAAFINTDKYGLKANPVHIKHTFSGNYIPQVSRQEVFWALAGFKSIEKTVTLSVPCRRAPNYFFPIKFLKSLIFFSLKLK